MNKETQGVQLALGHWKLHVRWKNVCFVQVQTCALAFLFSGVAKVQHEL